MTPIDPRRFALFGMPIGSLALGLAIVAFVSVPALVITVIAFTQVYTWSAAPVPTLLARRLPR